MPKQPQNNPSWGGVPIFRNDHSDLVAQLRLRACSVEEQPESDHGHSDCYLEREAADEIERLRSLIIVWAEAEDEADMIRGIDLYTAYEALRQAVGFSRSARQESETDDLRRDLPA